MKPISLFIVVPTGPSVKRAIPEFDGSGHWKITPIHLTSDNLSVVLEQRPCVCVFSVTNVNAGKAICRLLLKLRELRTARNESLRDPSMRIVLVCEDREIPVERWQPVGVHEFIFAPIVPKALSYKLDRHHEKTFFEDITIEVDERKLKDNVVIKNVTEAPIQDYQMVKSLTPSSTQTVFSVKALNLPKLKQHETKKIVLKAKISNVTPESGEWKVHEYNGEKQWHWQRRQITNESNQQKKPASNKIVYSGDQPVYDAEQKTWTLSGKKPKLEETTNDDNIKVMLSTTEEDDVCVQSDIETELEILDAAMQIQEELDSTEPEIEEPQFDGEEEEISTEESVEELTLKKIKATQEPQLDAMKKNKTSSYAPPTNAKEIPNIKKLGSAVPSETPVKQTSASIPPAHTPQQKQPISTLSGQKSAPQKENVYGKSTLSTPTQESAPSIKSVASSPAQLGAPVKKVSSSAITTDSEQVVATLKPKTSPVQPEAEVQKNIPLAKTQVDVENRQQPHPQNVDPVLTNEPKEQLPPSSNIPPLPQNNDQRISGSSPHQQDRSVKFSGSSSANIDVQSSSFSKSKETDAQVHRSANKQNQSEDGVKFQGSGSAQDEKSERFKSSDVEDEIKFEIKDSNKSQTAWGIHGTEEELRKRKALKKPQDEERDQAMSPDDAASLAQRNAFNNIRIEGSGSDAVQPPADESENNKGFFGQFWQSIKKLFT